MLRTPKKVLIEIVHNDGESTFLTLKGITYWNLEQNFYNTLDGKETFPKDTRFTVESIDSEVIKIASEKV